MATDREAGDTAFASDVFISYSRRDKVFAAKLERALERYKPPKGLDLPRRHLRVFRDEQDFTGVDYEKAIEEHLERSRSLIVLCSPAARASRYVDDEIRTFGALHGADRIIPVLLSGLPNNEARPGDEDRKAFPKALTELMAMPLAANYLGFESGRHKVGKEPFFDAWSTILANLYGVSRSELEQREKRRRARTRRIAAALASGVIAALSVALVVTLVSRQEAIEQRAIARAKQQEAETERDRAEAARAAERAAREEEARQRLLAEERRKEAERQREIARAEAVAARRETANRLAVQALEKLAERPEEALRLAVRAVETYDDPGDPTVPRALEALIKTAASFGGGRPVAPWRQDREAVLSNDLRWVAVSDADGTVRFAATGDAEARVLAPPEVLAEDERWRDRATELRFAGDRLFAVRGIERAESRRIVAWWWPLDEDGVAGEARPIGDLAGRLRPGFDLIVSHDGRWLSWLDRGRAYLRGVDPDARAHALRIGHGPGEPLRAFGSDARSFVLVASGRLRWWSLAPPEAGDGPGGIDELGSVEIAVRDHAALAIAPTPETDLFPAHEDLRTGTLRWAAVLGLGGDAEWWDLGASPPAQHPLPNVFAAFGEDLKVYGLEPGQARARLRFHDAGVGLLAEIALSPGEAGVAAVHAFERAAEGWRPLEHADIRTTSVSRTARTSGSVVIGPTGPIASSVTGYDVQGSSTAGVRSAEWQSVLALTVGLDGTLLGHVLDEDRSERIATEATAAAMPYQGFILVGHENGKLSLVDLEEDTEDNPIYLLSGHDAPVDAIEQTLRQERFVTRTAAGDARIWNRRHPALLWREDHDLSDDWRWLVVSNDDDDDLDDIWDLRAADPFARPITARSYTGARSAAHDLAAGWIATLHRVTDDDHAVSIRLWSLADGAPTAPDVERRLRIAGLERAWSRWPRLAVRGGEARLALTGGYPSTGVILDLLSDRPPRALTEPDRAYADLSLSPDLRWLLRRPRVEPGADKAAFELVDLRDWAAVRPARTVAGSASVRWPRFSPDSRRIVLDERVVDTATLDEVPLPPGEAGGRRIRYRVAHAPGRPALEVDDGVLWALPDPTADEASRAELVAGLDLGAVAWQEDGAWLALADIGGRVWLLRPPRGIGHARLAEAIRRAFRGAPLPTPWDPRARGAIDALSVFVPAGWVVATTEWTENDGEHALLWLRTPGGTWDEPMVFAPGDLLLAEGFRSDHRIRPDGRQAFLSDQLVTLDHRLLLVQARRLLGPSDDEPGR